MSLKTKVINGVTMLVSKVTGLSQDSAADREKMPKIITPGMPEVLRKAAAEGAVLLKMIMHFLLQTVQPCPFSEEISLNGLIQAMARVEMLIIRML